MHRIARLERCPKVVGGGLPTPIYVVAGAFPDEAGVSPRSFWNVKAGSAADLLVAQAVRGPLEFP